MLSRISTIFRELCQKTAQNRGEGQAEMKRVHDLWKDVREHLEKNGTYCRLRKFEEWVPLG